MYQTQYCLKFSQLSDLTDLLGDSLSLTQGQLSSGSSEKPTTDDTLKTASLEPGENTAFKPTTGLSNNTVIQVRDTVYPKPAGSFLSSTNQYDWLPDPCLCELLWCCNQYGNSSWIVISSLCQQISHSWCPLSPMATPWGM